MKRSSIGFAFGLLLYLPAIISACQPSPMPVEPKGREDASTPGVVQPPQSGAPQIGDHAARPAEPSTPGAQSCQTPMEAVQSVFKATPSATVTHLNQLQATSFIARFNAVTGGAMTGDEVLVIASPYFGDDIVTIFAKANCVLRTVAFRPAEPNHDQD